MSTLFWQSILYKLYKFRKKITAIFKFAITFYKIIKLLFPQANLCHISWIWKNQFNKSKLQQVTTFFSKPISSRHPNSTYSFDSFMPSVLISHNSWQVPQMASSICTELINLSFYWLANIGVSMGRSPKKNITYEFILTSSTVPSISCLSYLDGWDGRYVAVQGSPGLKSIPVSVFHERSTKKKQRWLNV